MLVGLSNTQLLMKRLCGVSCYHQRHSSRWSKFGRLLGAGDYGLRIIILSYMWLHPSHPDPKGCALRLLAHMLGVCMKQVRLAKCKALGVLWDFASLHQHPDPSSGLFRTDQEEKIFQKALSGLPIFFAHPRVFVWKITKHPPGYPNDYDLPPEANRNEYHQRGWPFTESCWAGLTKASSLVREFQIWQYTEASDAYRTARFDRSSRTAPLTPDLFAKALDECSFTNQKSNKPLVIQLHRLYFEKTFEQVENLDFSSMYCDDQAIVQVCQIIQQGYAPHLEPQ